MGDHGGSVVNLASIAGITPDPGMGAYAASKAALISVTRTLARDLGPQGVRVNAVAPGVVRTDFARILVETPGSATGSSSAAPSDGSPSPTRSPARCSGSPPTPPPTSPER